MKNIHSEWPEDELESVPACPICGSSVRIPLYKGLSDRVFFSAPGEWDMYRCEFCGSAYLDPRPTPRGIGLAYQRYFTHNVDAGLDLNSLGLKRKLRRMLANGYRNWRYGTKQRPANPLGLVVALIFPNNRAIIDAEMRHLPRSKRGQRLLDLGCGNGSFLYLARNAGWDVVGVDFDPKAVEAARRGGLDVRLGGVEDLDPAVEQFDVITLSHVVEHLHNPVGSLHACHDLLKNDGFLWLDTPNIDSGGRRLYGENWKHLDPPRHLVLFGLNSMRHALNKAGFLKTEVQHYRPLCLPSFSASEAIGRGLDPYSEIGKRVLPSADVRKAERLAKIDTERREFITIKAWKEW